VAFLDTTEERVDALVRAFPQQDPGATYAVRGETANATTFYPEARNERLTEAIGPQRAPDPIRAGDTPARPARMQFATYFAIRAIKSVMADTFKVRAVAPNHVAATPRGSQLAFTERTNIRRPPAQAYGSMYELDPPDRYAIL
jgi:hypothetical protein